MRSLDDHPGLFSFMVGLIILVMAGVLLSLLVDRRLGHSSRSREIAREMVAGESELEALRTRHQLEAAALERRAPGVSKAAAELEEIRSKLEEGAGLRRKLTAARNEHLRALEMLEGEFSQYRNAYRESAREKAVGEVVGTLTTRDGREFHETVISRVTDVGLEIKHLNGIARIQAPDLDSQLQDRFQWNDEERRAVLEGELANRQAHTRVPEPAVAPPKPPARRTPAASPTRPPPPDPAKLDAARRKVIAWRARVSEARSVREVSRSTSGRVGQNSVPGSLETWEARAIRLDRELAKAEAEFAAARAELSLLNPSDPLLRTPLRP